MSFTEFIRIGESVYWLATPEQVDLAREALKEAQKTSAIIYRTPSDEHDPKVWTKGQRLIAKKTEEMSVPAEAGPAHLTSSDSALEHFEEVVIVPAGTLLLDRHADLLCGL